MKKMMMGAVSAFALLGMAACSDTDTTTTQAVEPAAQDETIQPNTTAPAATEPGVIAPAPVPAD